MKKRILTVFNHRDDFAQEVLETLNQELDGVDLLSAFNADDARRKLENVPDYDLVVTHINIPAARDRTDLNEQQGLELLQFMYANHLDLPSIMIVPTTTDDIRTRTDKYPLAYVLDLSEKGVHWKHAIVDYANRYLFSNRRPYTAGEETRAVYMDISVSAENKSTEIWRVKFRVEGGKPTATKPVMIPVDKKSVERLIRLSEMLPTLEQKHEQWEDLLRTIGEELITILLRDNNIHSIFHLLLDRLGNDFEKFKIRFKVEPKVHPVVLEALAQRKGNDNWDYWMLKSPIFRSLETDSLISIYEPQLFSDHRLANCLIIKSDLPAGKNYVEKIEKELAPLDSIHTEAEELRAFLEGKPWIGEVEILPQNGGGCTAEMVETWLTRKGPWDIVHYAGHTFNFEKEGYLVFTGEKAPETVNSGTLRTWLQAARTRFLYLSSCHSSGAGFVYEITDYGIPSALGFRWKVVDDRAFEHAMFFYKNLLRCRSLDCAFLRTRKEMYKKYAKESAWAAPVLVMQN